MQKRSPDGPGPSGKTWPRWAPHVAHTASVRTMPWERSCLSVTLAGSMASVKLGQPHPASYFVSEENNGSSHTMQWYVPAS